MADRVKTLKVELEGDSASFTKAFEGGGSAADKLRSKLKLTASEMDAVHAEALKVDSAFQTTNQKAGKLADQFGKVSTTLARSADAFGMSSGALRTVGDVADVAAMGLGNLNKQAAGFNASSLAVAGAGLAIGSAIGSLLRQIPAVEQAADRAAKAIWSMFDPPPTQGESQSAFTARIQKVNDEVQRKYAEHLKKLGKTQREIADILGGRSTGADPKDQAGNAGMLARLGLDEASLDKADKAAAKAREVAKRHAADVKAFAKEIREAWKQSGSEADKTGFVIPPLPPVPPSLKTDIQQIAEGSWKAADAVERQALALAKNGVPAETIRQKLEQTSLSAAQIEQVMAGVNRQLSGAAVASGGFAAALKGALSRMPSVILGALQGGGNVGKSIGAALGGDMAAGLGEKAGKALSGKLGKEIGEGLGAIVPGLGSLLGAGLGTFAGKVFGKFFNSEAKKVNDLRDAFLESQGGFVELQKKLQGLTNQDLVKKVFDAKTVKDFDAAVREVMGLLDTQAEAQEALREATERYGFTVAELGPVAQRQKLDDWAGQLIKDFRILTGSGMDAGVVLSRMGPDISKFVQASVSAGQALPMAMKPMVEQLIASGQLLDENGEAFESAEAAGISFTESLTEGLARMIESIDRLVSALTGVPATPTTPGALPRTGGARYQDTIPGFANGTDGFRDFGRGTMAILHGWEAVVPRDSGSPLGGITVSSPIAPGAITVVASAGMDESALAQAVAKQLELRDTRLVTAVRRVVG